MPRSARAIAAGVCYHLINRGNNRATVFHTRAEYAAFVDLFMAAQVRVRLDLLAVCLMPNHFHIVARSASAHGISRWMHWLLTTHTSRIRRDQESTGRIWQGRFKAFPIQQDGHLLTVMRYVERNALRAGLVRHARDWEWSSLAWRFGGDDELLCQPPVTLPPDWEQFVESPQSPEEVAAVRRSVNRQRPFGADEWVSEVTPRLGLDFSVRPRGRPRKQRT